MGGFAEHGSSYAIIKKLQDLEENTKKFLILKKARFHKEIGKSADIDAKKKKWQKRKILPLTTDMLTLYALLDRVTRIRLLRINPQALRPALQDPELEGVLQLHSQ